MALYYTPPQATTLLPDNVQGYVPFEIKVKLDTSDFAAGTIVNLCKFPKDATLVDPVSWKFAFEDLDSHASQTLDLDIQISSNEDGSSPTNIVTQVLWTSGAPTAQLDALDGTAGITAPVLTDLSEKWLALACDVAAATAVDGYVTVSGVYRRGTVTEEWDATNITGVTI